MVFLQVVLSFHDTIVRMSLISIHNFKTKQGDFNCGASSQADFILNHFLSKFLNSPKFSLKFPLKFSISSQPGWQAGTIKVTLPMAKN